MKYHNKTLKDIGELPRLQNPKEGKLREGSLIFSSVLPLAVFANSKAAVERPTRALTPLWGLGDRN